MIILYYLYYFFINFILFSYFFKINIQEFIEEIYDNKYLKNIEKLSIEK